MSFFKWMAAILDFRSEGLASFILQIAPIFPNQVRVNWHRGVGGDVI